MSCRHGRYMPRPHRAGAGTGSRAPSWLMFGVRKVSQNWRCDGGLGPAHFKMVIAVCFVKCRVSVQFSRVQLFATPWTAAYQASLSITSSQSLLKLMFILCRHLLFLPSVFPSIRVFSNESALRIRWPKYRSFSFNIRPSSAWFTVIKTEGTLKLTSGC